MKTLLLNILYFFSYYSGLNNFFYYLTTSRQRVVTFHNVIPDILYDDSIHLGVSCTESTFEYQLEEIGKKFKFTTELSVNNSCIITFDDGYNNNLFASEILTNKEINAVFFITQNLVLTNEMLWIDRIMFWFSYVPENKYKLYDFEFVITKNNRGICYGDFYQYILNNYDKRKDFISQLDHLFSFSDLEINLELYNYRFKALTVNQIDIMKNNGHLIALHSTNHDVLSKLSESELSNEINQCENFLSTFYNSNYFSYPFGREEEVSNQVKSCLGNSTFSCAFINKWQWTENTDNYSIQRISLPNTKNKYLISAHFSGFYYFLKQIFNG